MYCTLEAIKSIKIFYGDELDPGFERSRPVSLEGQKLSVYIGFSRGHSEVTAEGRPRLSNGATSKRQLPVLGSQYIVNPQMLEAISQRVGVDETVWAADDLPSLLESLLACSFDPTFLPAVNQLLRHILAHIAYLFSTATRLENIHTYVLQLLLGRVE
jgi:hypothetical protein